ncbi:hypothetical protein [Caballeronia grimmiae]|uniref:hypothetical protein n=2 Tax=Caballeronia grimmiae TaxID=1071679 RepID=UPI0038BBEC52
MGGELYNTRKALVRGSGAVAQSAGAILGDAEAAMQKDIEVGDYMLAMSAVPKPRPGDQETEAWVEGYAVRVRVTRVDGQPVHGSTLADDSGEMTGDHGPFETVAQAMAHGEAWGRHYVARVLGHGV